MGKTKKDTYKLHQTHHPETAKCNRDALMVQLFQKVVANGATDLKFVVSPATLTPPAASAGAGAKRGVIVKLTDAIGNVHEWFNGTITVALSETSTSGTLTGVDKNTGAAFTTSLKIVNGIGHAELTKVGSHIAGETNTFTASAQTILGASVLVATSVETVS